MIYFLNNKKTSFLNLKIGDIFILEKSLIYEKDDITLRNLLKSGNSLLLFQKICEDRYNNAKIFSEADTTASIYFSAAYLRIGATYNIPLKFKCQLVIPYKGLYSRYKYV